MAVKSALNAEFSGDFSNVYSYMLVSRKKDNKHIAGFRQRTRCFLVDEADKNAEKVIQREWERFRAEAQEGEHIREYRQVNPRNMAKVHKALVIALIDEQFDLLDIENKLVSIASKPENRIGNRFLVDIDYNDLAIVKEIEAKINEKLLEINKENHIPCEVFKSKNNYGLVIPNGIDSRDLCLEYSELEFKRDGSRLMRHSVVSKDVLAG